MAAPIPGIRNLADRPSLAAALALAALVIIALAWPRQADRWRLELEMATATSPMGQVFSSTQAGYGEEASVLLSLVADGSRQRYIVDIPVPVNAMRVRVDPGSSPGPVRLYSVRIRSPFEHSLQGDALRTALRPLNDLRLDPGGGAGAISMESTGNDPFFDVSIEAPPEAPVVHFAKRSALVAGLLLLSFVMLCAGRSGWTALRTLVARHAFLSAASMAIATVAVLTALGLGCASITCSARGGGYGLALFAGAIGMALVGAMCLAALAWVPGRDRRPRLFLAILVGQVALALYIYLRSTLHAAIPAVPLTRLEFVLIVAASAAMLWRRSGGPGAVAQLLSGRWLALELGCLLAICVVVADRELPRLVMLSSDPDVHAFFARQLERFGAVYHQQGDWGSEALSYPAGSPALIYAWSRLTWLDVSNTLSALPLLQAFLAALAIGELVAIRGARRGRAAVLLLLAVAITAAGFLFPIYSRFSHMEGVGRQLSIACAALVIVIISGSTGAARPSRLGQAALLAGALFLLATLNPVNVVLPCILVLGCMAYAAIRRESLPWPLLLACLACPLLLLMDPYYLQLLTGSPVTPKLSLDGAMARMSVAEIGSGWLAQVTQHLPGLLQQEFKLIPDHPFPTFLAMAAGLLIALLAAARGAGHWPALAFGLVVAVAVLLSSALMQAVAGDARLYLLPYYFQFSLAQYRALLLTLMAVSIAGLAWRRRAGTPAVALLLVACVALPYFIVRPVQPMRFEPRVDYCGSLGCASPSDVAVVTELEQLVRSRQIEREDGMLPRILVPNLQAWSGPEAWVFPTGGSRHLALADALPVAFYYYQGDGDFTTGNYMEHVCNRLDREWLRSERIHYVFLPEQREGTCIATMDTLAETEEVVLRHGNSIVIRLRGANG